MINDCNQCGEQLSFRDERTERKKDIKICRDCKNKNKPDKKISKRKQKEYSKSRSQKNKALLDVKKAIWATIKEVKLLNNKEKNVKN